MVRIVEADNGFGLRPPIFVGIDQAVAVCFVRNAAIGIDAFLQRSFSHLQGNRDNLLGQLFIAERFGCFMQQPAALDVVAVGDVIRLVAPLLVEEQLEVARTPVDDMVKRNTNELVQRMFQHLARPHPVQARIALQHVKMSIHRLLLVQIFVA
ncbi:hypothetical protein D3C84_909930 [compost metagenome]